MSPASKMAEREVRIERADGEPTAGLQRAGEALEHRAFVVAAAQQPEPALAQADDRVELAVERELAQVRGLESRVPGHAERCSRSRCERDELGRQVDADDVDPASRERERVAAGSASRVEDACTGRELERGDEEVDLLFGSGRERLHPRRAGRPVRVAEERRDRVEPARDAPAPRSLRVGPGLAEAEVDHQRDAQLR